MAGVVVVEFDVFLQIGGQAEVLHGENGYYDMATPFFATEFTMEHLGLPAELQKNVKLDYYNAGHMMYLHDEDRVSLHNQIASFIDRATKP